MGYLSPLSEALRHFVCCSSLLSLGMPDGKSCLVHESTMSSSVDNTRFARLFKNPTNGKRLKYMLKCRASKELLVIHFR